MTQTELPDLPWPWKTVLDADGVPVPVFRAFQLRDYALMAREAVEVPQWVSVEERLPPLNTEVLVAFDRIAIPSTAQLAQCGGLRQWLWPKENDEADGALAVTHWMPLPEHPNVGPDGNFIVDPFAPTKGQL